MSDPPPKPKPGSLRDRIAAFERPAQQQPVAPVPRPKPGGVQWRPRLQPHGPVEDGDGHDQSPASGGEGGGGGALASASMSASDARESIRQGGSLRERMAALQGRGGFGGSAPSSSSSPPPPPPLAQKPKWKPPPQAPVVSAEDEEGGIQNKDANPIVPTSTTTTATTITTTTEEKHDQHDQREEVAELHAESGEGEGEAKDPEEEEERQRRAAIAARMARLGGARVGMAPPGMFGGARPPPPPVARKPESVRNPAVKETEKERGMNEGEGEGEGEAQGVNASIDAGATSPVLPKRADTPAADVDAEHSPTPSHSRSPPPAMPAPAVPRRTAPPRRKPPKSPVPAPPEEVALVEAAEAESAGLETHPEVEQDVLGDAEPLTKEEEKEKVAVVLPVVGTVAAVVAEEEEHVEALEETVVEEPEQQEHEYEHEEEDEDTRRRRIAERIAKMGAINPFAPPPPRSMSGSDAGLASPPASAAVLVRRSSVDSVGSVKSGRVAKRASVGSISSISGGAALATRGSIDSAKEVEPGAAMGGPVAGGIPEQDEREESVPENVPEGGNDAMAMSMILERSPPLPPLPPSDIEEEAHGLGPSPALDRSTRPPVPVPQATQTQTQTQTQVGDHRKWASGYITRPPQSDEEREHDRATIEQGVKQTRDASPPPLPVSPRISSTGLCRRFTADEDEGRGGDEEPRPLPIPHRPSIVSPKPVWTKAPDVVEEEDEYEKDEEQDEVKHVPPPPRRQVPLPPPSPSPAHPINADSITPQDSIVVEGTKQEQELELEPEPTSAHSDAPLVIPPPERRYSRDDVTHDKPLPHRMSFRQPHPVQARSPESEVMDDEEGDPIDPSIHVPKRVSVRSGGGSVPSTPTSPIPPVPAVSIHKVDPQDEEEQQSREVVDSASMGDTESARRHTIAERMAKLGGIKFGAAPPIPGTRLPLAASTERADEVDERRETDEKAVEGEGRGEDEKKGVDEDEEEERARKERIAAKLAGMGGMRIGMMPPMMGIPPRSAQRPQPPLPTREEAATPVPTPTSPTVATRGPPTRPPPPPLPQDAEWERGSASNSEDGVKVEMEESDMEEVDHEDARMEDEEGYEEGEMVAPPPPPRGHPPLSLTQRTRPPVPSTARTRKASDGTIAAPARRGSGGSGTTTTTTTTSTTITQRPRGQSDYVMVDEPQNAEEGEEEEVPPPPPARPVQRRATRESPVRPHPPPLQLMSDSISSQWELTSAPSGSVGLGTMTTDLSSSWTEAGDLTGSRITLVPPAHAAPPAEPSTPSTAERRLSSDELMAIWGRVGVQVCEAATGLLERSKKAVVGDGTYAGYVHAVLDGVPNAARHGYHEWGYLVYAQTGTAVHKRVSDIMPGDVVELVDARFKGHKGLQTYSQHVGAAGEALVGVVSEMESKKSKVRVMQANRQVGQPMVESASYRLEDLKSGTVNVYRVLEA